jgi:thiopeptide-type bacteriocin biosynthesis protein
MPLSKYSTNNLLARSPLLPLNALLSVFKYKNGANLLNLFSHSSLSQALYTASPVLYEQWQKELQNCNTKHTDKKLLQSLLKYYIRSATRCTPYGMFAGLNTCNISNNETELNIQSKPLPKLRLDMDYLVNVYHDLCKDGTLSQQLIYYPNNSLYKIGNKWRYTEYRQQNKRTVHHLVNIDDNMVLNKLIKQCNQGFLYTECIKLITNFGFEKQEAESYLNELIESQVLVSELYPNVTGNEYQEVLFNKLAQFKQYEKLLSEVNNVLNNNESIIVQTSQIKSVLSQYFTTAINESRFIQVDTLKQVNNANINEQIIENIKEAASVLNRLSAFDESESILSKFKKAFYERYEDAEVPLLNLLDTDIGINYKNSKSETEYRSSNKNNMLWDVFTKFKFDLYLKAQKENLTEIILTDEDIKNFKDPKHHLPDSLGFMGELLHEKNETKIIFGGISNNATVLPGRFGHLDESIKKLCIDIAEQEEALQPDKIFAEVVHISEGRLGNILTRPHYRKYEIPYLAQSTLPYENQIQVSDLMVSIQNNKIVLRSKKLNKEILPRMANAHNYSGMGLPIYHFLCDLQHQGIKAYLGWSWGFLGNEQYLPRVTYKNVILSQAFWNVKTDKLKTFTKLNVEEKTIQFSKIKQEYQLNDLVYLSEGDNELLLDLNNAECIDLLIDVAKKTNQIKLTECLFNLTNLLVKDENDNGYTNEIIIPFIRIKEEKEAEAKDLITIKRKENEAQRNFEPYSNWVYVKIYTGNKTADKILSNQIFKICSLLIKQKVIKKWFFIRYADPKNHIRLRFNLTDSKSFNELNNALNKNFSNLVKSGLIWKIQTDTYQRELERYGNDSIEISEDFFYINSQVTLEILKLFTNDKAQENRFLVGLLCVVKLYDGFGFSTEERLALIEKSALSYGNEFNVPNSENLRTLIKDKHRKFLPDIECLLHNKENKSQLDINFYGTINKLNNKQEKTLYKIAILLKEKNYEKSLDELMPSYIHMFLNRFFASNQRYEEMMIYQILEKYYKALKAREKYNSK